MNAYKFPFFATLGIIGVLGILLVLNYIAYFNKAPNYAYAKRATILKFARAIPTSSGRVQFSGCLLGKMTSKHPALTVADLYFCRGDVYWHRKMRKTPELANVQRMTLRSLILKNAYSYSTLQKTATAGTAPYIGMQRIAKQELKSIKK